MEKRVEPGLPCGRTGLYRIRRYRARLAFCGLAAQATPYRPTFYGVIGVASVAAVVFNFLHIDRIKALFHTAVINGLVAPAAHAADRHARRSTIHGR